MKFIYNTLRIALMLLPVLLITSPVSGQKKKEEARKENKLDAATFSGLKWRGIGPAFTSGRISDIAVNPRDHSEWYIAVSSGHVWKTGNNGTTFKPVFDNYGAYAMGCVAIDPVNPNTVWLGTGENNHQRALGYGNGVYKSLDGGQSWTNMGLKESRQVGMIAIHPTNPDIVFVAAEGSVWGPGGDRGLYKTTDGGKTWTRVLEISTHTGVNNVVMDPSDPQIIYATSEQRRRHVHTKIGGGPESAIYKSTDGGNTWRKLTKGLPSGHIGGMGIAVSTVNPYYVYSIIEAEGETGGFFRSTDKGESWTKMSSHSSSGQYYNEIYCDPVDVNKVYSVETVSKVTLDGGKTWTALGLNKRHVDDHALWIDPADSRHFLIGGDGGIYETFDEGQNYLFKPNLPVTQFYRVAVDNGMPFYHVYGGTQDNNSFGGPSRNLSSDGVTSSEWYVTVGGDGFWQAIDPENPDIVYSEWQYGNSIRYDRKSGEALVIKPQPRKGEDSYRWNWDAPMILSPHLNTRLYTAANKVFRSDDRGQSWEVISGDLTRSMDRNTWKVMDKYWSIDAVVKDMSTSLFGTIVSLAESGLKEGLIYAGTDDGVIQVTENGGQNWRKIESFPGVPEYTYVSDICPSRFDENVVYASFNNLKRDDFRPYLLKSTDKGKNWSSISSNLPENGSVHTIEQDFVKPELLFAGTEFAIYFSADEGREWVELSSGIPDIAVRDIAIQQRENDLVVATFGRGFYILDDYSPLRTVSPALLEKEAHIFPVKDPYIYIQTSGKYGQGATEYSAPNPPYGVTFTWYLKEGTKTRSELRKEKEKDLFEKGEKIYNPTLDELKKEGEEEKPHILFTIHDENGQVARRLTTATSKGINRTTWDLRYESTQPVVVSDRYNPLATGRSGILAMPGKYTVTMERVVDGKSELLAGPVEFTASSLNNTSLPPADRKAVFEFQQKTADLSRQMQGAVSLLRELSRKMENILQSLQHTPGANRELIDRAKQVRDELGTIRFRFYGHDAKASWEELPPAPMPLMGRLNNMLYARQESTSDITKTERDAYEILLEEFPPLLEKIRKINDASIPGLEKELDRIGAPWTPGRISE